MYRQFHTGNTNEQQYHLDPHGGAFGYNAFQHSLNGIDPQLQQSSQHLSPPLRQQPTSSPGHARHASNDSNGPMRQSTRSLSPHVRGSTPSRASYVPTDRALPSTDVTADNIVDAYVAFILYCNPNFPLHVDTSTLRTNFQSSPKSDDKSFEIYRLFELLKKFDAKEIKTWGQLALDLGVEAPDVSKGQSVQKVQQYSVRLKRWMRAMHVDAFSEYLLGKQHAYYQEIPPPDDPYPATGRDGVLPEEDLAIRALDPSFRPKRGRRRNSEAEQDDASQPGAQNVQSAQPQSAYPASAFPSANMTFGRGVDPWSDASALQQHDFDPWNSKLDAPQSAIVAPMPSHMRWQNPATPHPMSALPGSMNSHIEAALGGEPKSSVTPARKRRKHGPAVSSAWPSSNAPGSKPRGRPPASRNVQDGPFTTFPADPNNDKPSTFSLSAVPTVESAETQNVEFVQQLPEPAQRQSEGGSRPGRLSLQVPRHTGGPVRLATPPRVMITNETSESEQSTMDKPPPSQQRKQKPVAPTSDTDMPGFAFETLKRVVASDLLRAELLGRQHRLNGEEAKRLADAVLQRLNVPREDDNSLQDNFARLTSASWLGVGGQLNVPPGLAVGSGKRLTVTRFRVDADGYEEVVSAYDMESTASREVFDFSWSSTMGSCNGIFELKGLSLAEPAPKSRDVHDAILDTWVDTARRAGIDDERIRKQQQNFANEHPSTRSEPNAQRDNIDWKAKYQALEFGSRMAKGEFHRYRERLIERILETLI